MLLIITIVAFISHEWKCFIGSVDEITSMKRLLISLIIGFIINALVENTGVSFFYRSRGYLVEDRCYSRTNIVSLVEYGMNFGKQLQNFGEVLGYDSKFFSFWTGICI